MSSAKNSDLNSVATKLARRWKRQMWRAQLHRDRGNAAAADLCQQRATAYMHELWELLLEVTLAELRNGRRAGDGSAESGEGLLGEVFVIFPRALRGFDPKKGDFVPYWRTCCARGGGRGSTYRGRSYKGEVDPFDEAAEAHASSGRPGSEGDSELLRLLGQFLMEYCDPKHRDNAKRQRDADWFVEKRLRGSRQDKLANKSGVAPSTVMRGVDRVAAAFEAWLWDNDPDAASDYGLSRSHS